MSLATNLAARRRAEAIEYVAATAMEMFERDGFDATSIEAIASAAQVSIRTFYRYFPGKEDILLYDLPETLEGLRQALDEQLSDGLTPWEAVSETYLRFISRFDRTDPGIPSRRMRLCLAEPALRAAYLRFIHEAEQVVADELHKHRRTNPVDDEYPNLVAVAATGAYRVTLFTHIAGGQNLAEHLRVALNRFAGGLGVDTLQRPTTSNR